MDQRKIGNFICLCRKDKKLTQQQLAEKIGVSSKSVSRWENGNTMPDYSLLKDLCNELGISVNELLAGQRILAEEYVNVAEENFIFLKKKVDRVIKIFDIIQWIMVILTIGLFILNMYYNWLYRASWDNSNIILISRIALIITIVSSIVISLLKYDTKK